MTISLSGARRLRPAFSAARLSLSSLGLLCLLCLLLPGAPCRAQAPAPARQSVGLVLSGGGAKGIAHIGVIQALEDHDIAVDYVTGTSMGAIVGSLYAMGYSPAQMMDLIKSKGFSHWSQGKVDQAYLYYLLEQYPTPALFSLNVGGGAAPGTNLAGVIPTSIINPIPMSFAFMELFGASTAQCRSDFDRLFVPFRCVASDVYHKHKVVFSKGSLGDAVRASMSFPMVFRPIEINGLLMYDGGIYDNFPFDVMHRDFNPDIMIGVNVSGPNKKPEPGNVMQQLEDMIMQKSDYDLPEDYGVCINVPVLQFGLLDWDKADEIYAIGYRSGEQMADSIMRRVTARTPAAELAKRRRLWRSATPKLMFDSVAATGCSEPQAEYLRRIFTPDRHDHRPDTFGIEHARLAFYRAVSPGRFSSLVPHAVAEDTSSSSSSNENLRGDSLFRLQLNAMVKRNFNVAAGGYLTSSANSFLYVGATYNNLTSHFTSATLSAWVGQSYCAVMGRVRHDLATDVPMSIALETSLWRQKYHENGTYFYQVKSPTFVTNAQFMAMARYQMAPTRRSILGAGAGYGHLWDSFFNDRPDFQGAEEATVRQRESDRFDLGQVYLEWEHSTLDNGNYPTRGLHVGTRLAGLLGVSRYRPGGEEHFSRQHLLWSELRASLQYYIPAARRFSLGLTLDGVASTKPLLQNYNATMVSAPAFTPTPSAYNAYNSAFRSNSWVAAGLCPVWAPSGLFQVRGTFNCFLNARRITEDPLTLAPRYSGWFDQTHFFGEINAMLTTPFATLSAYVNYQSHPARNWNVGISLGLFHLAPTFL